MMLDSQYGMFLQVGCKLYKYHSCLLTLFSPDGNNLQLAGCGNVRIWNTTTWDKGGKLFSSSDSESCLLPNGSMLISGSLILLGGIHQIECYFFNSGGIHLEEQ